MDRVNSYLVPLISFPAAAALGCALNKLAKSDRIDATVAGALPLSRAQDCEKPVEPNVYRLEP